jgi:hypothetical protein
MTDPADTPSGSVRENPPLSFGATGFEGSMSAEAGDEDERRVFFRSAPVFDVSQTSAIPGADVASLCPPGAPVEGDTHAHLIPPLIAHASELGYRVEERELPSGGPGGWCDPRAKLIVVGHGPANGRVRVLVHELAHAHGIGYADYTRRQAEVLVDTVVFSPCQGRSSESAASSMGDSCHQ